MDKIFYPLQPKAKKHQYKSINIISSDKALIELVDKAAEPSGHLFLSAAPLKGSWDRLTEHLSEFDAFIFDIDGIKEDIWINILSRKWGSDRMPILVVFNPLLLSESQRKELQRIAKMKKVILLSKPLSLGLFYEAFLRHV